MLLHEAYQTKFSSHMTEERIMIFGTIEKFMHNPQLTAKYHYLCPRCMWF